MTLQKRILIPICAAALLMGAQAEPIKNPYPIRSRPQPSLSKAGAVQSRPRVPNRTVVPPAGAAYGTYYYYDYRRYYDPPYYSVESGPNQTRQTGIPGLEERPGDSKRSDDSLKSY